MEEIKWDKKEKLQGPVHCGMWRDTNPFRNIICCYECSPAKCSSWYRGSQSQFGCAETAGLSFYININLKNAVQCAFLKRRQMFTFSYQYGMQTWPFPALPSSGGKVDLTVIVVQQHRFQRLSIPQFTVSCRTDDSTVGLDLEFNAIYNIQYTRP